MKEEGRRNTVQLIDERRTKLTCIAFGILCADLVIGDISSCCGRDGVVGCWQAGVLVWWWHFALPGVILPGDDAEDDSPLLSKAFCTNSSPTSSNSFSSLIAFISNNSSSELVESLRSSKPLFLRLSVFIFSLNGVSNFWSAV